MQLEVNIQLEQGHFNLDVAFSCQHSALGVFGPSGCGKSTLFRALAGFAHPKQGSIAFAGQTLCDVDRGIFVPPHKRGMGLVFQDMRLFPHWSVEQNLKAAECLKDRVRNRPFGYDDVVDLLEIRELCQHRISQLSGGEQQRVAIGRTLLSNPRLLLMDEPVSGLDATLKAQILPFFTKIHRTFNIPALLVSHDLSDILQLTDNLLLLRDGRVVGMGALGELVKVPERLSAFQGAGLSSVLRARVLRHDADVGITELQVEGSADSGCIVMECCDAVPEGETIVVGIPADQVALASNAVSGISMRNQLESRVRNVVKSEGRALCVLDTEIGPLFAEVTHGIEKQLELRPGNTIWALFKTLAVDHLGV
jgi:molybdate transport system ATP-binding protein